MKNSFADFDGGISLQQEDEKCAIKLRRSVQNYSISAPNCSNSVTLCPLLYRYFDVNGDTLLPQTETCGSMKILLFSICNPPSFLLQTTSSTISFLSSRSALHCLKNKSTLPQVLILISANKVPPAGNVGKVVEGSLKKISINH